MFLNSAESYETFSIAFGLSKSIIHIEVVSRKLITVFIRKTKVGQGI